jgi:4-amino-4-deoxy-L-arabinose transferase-like glycosyltransferase
MSESPRHHLIVISVAVIVLFTNLGGPRLWDRDEPRNAGCAAEMLARGDWVVPVFNGELRTHKPVLLYWLMMASYAVFGVSEFSARFASAALSVGTVLLTYHIGRRWFDAQAGLWAAIALATALMFGLAGRAATPDATLIFCSTLAIFFLPRPVGEGRGEGAIPFGPSSYFKQIVGPPKPPERERIAFHSALCIYAAMGLAILAKGPVGLVLPTAVIGMYLLIMRLPLRNTVAEVVRLPSLAIATPPSELSRVPLLGKPWIVTLARPFHPIHFLQTCWAMRPITATAVALAVALPWYLWVTYRTDGAWTAGFFLDHNLRRATESMEGHRGNVLFYPVALAIGFFPWSIFLAPLLIDTAGQLRRRVATSPGYILAACWVGVYVALFSLAKTKLPSYITPCYPGLALLMGAFVARLARGESHVPRVWLQVATGVAMVVGLGMLIGLPIAAAQVLPGEELLSMIGLLPLVAGVIGWLFVRHGDHLRLARSYAVAAVAFSTALLALVPTRVDTHQQNDRLLAAIKQRSTQPEIGYYDCLEPTWVFYSGQPLTNVRTINDEADMTPELAPAGPRQWQARPRTLVREFFDSGSDRFLITTRAGWERAKAEAPPEATIVAEAPYFMRKGDLVVVTCASREKTARRGGSTLR